VIVDAMTKPVELGEVIWKRETRILLVKVSDDLEDSRWKLQEERMVDKLDETVKRQL
jgi:hypothetical protein